SSDTGQRLEIARPPFRQCYGRAQVKIDATAFDRLRHNLEHLVVAEGQQRLAFGRVLFHCGLSVSRQRLVPGPPFLPRTPRPSTTISVSVPSATAASLSSATSSTSATEGVGAATATAGAGSVAGVKAAELPVAAATSRESCLIRLSRVRKS